MYKQSQPQKTKRAYYATQPYIALKKWWTWKTSDNERSATEVGWSDKNQCSSGAGM